VLRKLRAHSDLSRGHLARSNVVQLQTSAPVIAAAEKYVFVTARKSNRGGWYKRVEPQRTRQAIILTCIVPHYVRHLTYIWSLIARYLAIWELQDR